MIRGPMSIPSARRLQKKELDADLFYRQVNQYLAETGDRNLRFSRRSEPDYQPFTNGFTRRSGEILIVSEVHGEDRLRPKDEIIAINGQPLRFLYGNIEETGVLF